MGEEQDLQDMPQIPHRQKGLQGPLANAAVAAAEAAVGKQVGKDQRDWPAVA